jgi:hypothetical protein
MKRRKSSSQKTKRLRPADFPRPKRVSQEKVLEICEGLGIPDRYVAELKEHLDDLVDYVHESMSQKEAADRQGDRVRILTMRKQFKEIRYILQGLRIDGRLAVRSTAERLADILSGDRIRHHFPNDAPSKPRLFLGNRPLQRQPTTDVTHLNYQFIRGRAPETLNALLLDLESALASALASLDSHPGARGGPEPLRHRHVVLLNLASIWHRVGKKPVGTPNSFFAVFCQTVFEAMEWPIDGLDSAIPDAIQDLPNRHQKRARLSK